MDLFAQEQKKETKKDQLFSWLSKQRYIRTSDIIKWGIENYYTSADRVARQIATTGTMRRLTKQEKTEGCFDTAQGVYVWLGGFKNG